MKKFSKALAFLPLLLMGAGVWYYIQHRVQGAGEEHTAPSGPLFKTGAPEAAPAPKPGAGPAGVAAARLPEAYDPKAPGLDIQGSPAFKDQVTQALKLIWTADRDTFLVVRNNLQVIRNDSQTGFYTEEGRSVAALSNSHAFRSLTWCAGVIGHQAWHASYTAAKRRRNARRAGPPPPPGESRELVVDANPLKGDFSNMAAILYVEDKAAAFQLEVLRKVGAPKRETDPVFRRAPRDFHLAHDGNYAIKP